MTFRRYAVFAAILLTVAIQAITAQSRETFKARLSALPADARTRAALAGSGSVTATLEGTKLSVTGSFEGLVTPATTANLHDAVAAGVRGPAIADLTIAKATSGMITGSVELTAPQLANLHKGGLYVEIHSEKAPDGAIWGWFLK
jgi:hypothetical protein